MKKGFTLIELMISIIILSVIVIYLYKSYAEFNKDSKHLNSIYKKTDRFQKVKKVIYLDFLTAFPKSISVIHLEKNSDLVFMQTKNSVHDRINPYVTYIFKDGFLYRIESFVKPTYPFDVDFYGDVDKLLRLQSFRVYKALKKDSNTSNPDFFIIDLKQDAKNRVVYKIKALLTTN